MASEPSAIQKIKEPNSFRFVTFNVNGVRTLFQYQPFSEMNQSPEKIFDYFNADIITFQELKIERLSLAKWGKLENFYSFISIPHSRKGYSGVGCWVRILPREHPFHECLQVVKAEEGITGILGVKSGKELLQYNKDPSIGIGGYDSLGYVDDKEALKIDSEGRCVMIELACNLVVISVYCPANSTLSEEGELYRVKFLKVLFKRIRNLDALGKRVVLMGDLNVCRDFIDHAESLERDSVVITDIMGGLEIEEKYQKSCRNFLINPEVPHRRMLNQMLSDSIIPAMADEGILVDTTRLTQTRKRLKMYTVWNTLKNLRPANYGSRIDFILVSAKMQDKVKASDILPQVLGSDHCPVYADISVDLSEADPPEFGVKIPKFEARYKYNLTHGNILEMFGKTNRKASVSKVTKKSTLSSSASVGEAIRRTASEHIKQNPLNKSKERISHFRNCFGEPPVCRHGEEAILKTSKTLTNPGKRFWICKYPRGSLGDKTSSCGFFQWA
ncbi:probable DNA-(apurinic or apyrimidinic site) lyase 2 [Zygosaccharomyces bailii]|nr:probable DNA-(apurinic or apyrimidinic site) lyase 2 [Zygosaccharomyces bailii]